jgi:hypothetical protein
MSGNSDMQTLRQSANTIWNGRVNGGEGEVVELNKFSHAFDSCQDMSNGTSWDGYVICTFEVDVLLNLFEYVLKQDICMDEAAWQNIVKVSACLLSPWQQRELSKEKCSTDSESKVARTYDDFVPKMTAYLDSLFDLAFQNK